jgi:hypothetical protein
MAMDGGRGLERLARRQGIVLCGNLHEGCA